MEANRKDSPSAKWFGYALQSLAVLAIHDGVCPSCEIAVKMDSQATMLRRIMAQLAKYDLVVAKEGRDGGYLLARPANRITFADVYEALQLSEPLSQALLDSTSDGIFGKEMQCYFTKFAGEWQKRVVFELQQRTIADLIAGYK
ncbi:RrF2 family transcriptional regulator [Paenibacillus sp. GYB003]|uniref:RrF2 family transcriptional regulator n=1 Tax=Paenibacillus sp. GYB003 TaxID=2994392 RepID=UPI002F96101E